MIEISKLKESCAIKVYTNGDITFTEEEEFESYMDGIYGRHKWIYNEAGNEYLGYDEGVEDLVSTGFYMYGNTDFLKTMRPVCSTENKKYDSSIHFEFNNPTVDDLRLYLDILSAKGDGDRIVSICGSEKFYDYLPKKKKDINGNPYILFDMESNIEIDDEE